MSGHCSVLQIVNSYVDLSVQLTSVKISVVGTELTETVTTAPDDWSPAGTCAEFFYLVRTK